MLSQTVVGAALVGILGAVALRNYQRWRAAHPVSDSRCPEASEHERRRARRNSALFKLVVVLAILATWQILETPRPEVYRLSVSLARPDGLSTSEVHVSTTVGGLAKPVPNGWQIDIPRAHRPTNGVVTIRGKTDHGFVGSATILLDRDPNPVATLSLTLAASHVRGSVEDESGRTLAGVRVSVKGYENEGVLTGQSGAFFLPAHVGENQPVVVRAEKEGFEPWVQIHVAGDAAMTIRLFRSEETVRRRPPVEALY